MARASVVFGLGLLLDGCKIVPFATERKQATEMTQKIEALHATVENQASQVVNAVWPYALTLVALIVVGGLVLIYYIRSTSYLRQKPQWEKMKGCNGH